MRELLLTLKSVYRAKTHLINYMIQNNTILFLNILGGIMHEITLNTVAGINIFRSIKNII